MNKIDLWQRYQRLLYSSTDIGLRVDVSRMNFDDAFLNRMTDPVRLATKAMEKLEGGAKANVDEDRMVGHYWLRAPDLAPEDSIRSAIKKALSDVKAFAAHVHEASIKPQRADEFLVALVIGIGGSALGPQFVSDALGDVDDAMLLRFIDNTDPDGIDRVLGELDESLDQTLTIVISKSGKTKETRNAMMEVAAAYGRMGLDFAKHAVAVTCEGSALHEKATKEEWIQTFPMWDWVGGRTSETSVVGLLPAALQGIDIDAMLGGARDCDVATRESDKMKNPAAMLALTWYYACDSRGLKNMVILPYRDRLLLLGRYLQQLVMESLGKEVDRNGKVVHQGLTVYGNKGSTDQHAYVQQLRDGTNDFFATFVRVLESRQGDSIEVEDDMTCGDFLDAFWLGTREALFEKGRESITITLDRVDARAIGVLIALFERAVGLYAELININAYDQPGVEAGKAAAGAVLDLRKKVHDHFKNSGNDTKTADEVAKAIGEPDAAESISYILDRRKK